MRLSIIAFCLALIAAVSSPAKAQIQAGDLIFGLQTPCEDVDMMDPECDPAAGEYTNTLELVRGLQGTPAPVTPSPWDMSTTPFIGSVEFDNFNGVSHNGAGNLLGVNFGPDSATGGGIYSFGTDGSNPNGELIAMPLTGLGGGTILTSRLTNISVSPDNTKVAVNGYNTGTFIIYDYTAGDTMGGGAALNNGRETSAATALTNATSGTAWINNDTALGLSPDGTLFEVDAATGTATFATSLTIAGGQATLSSLEYNSSISPFVYGVVSFFAGGTTNELVVLDPNNGYSVVNQFDFSTEAQTAREIAFDADGNLYIGGFGSAVSVINGAAANAATMTAADISLLYESEIFSSFNGLDVALAGETTAPDGDFNDDGLWNCTDINLLTAAVASGMNDPAFDMNDDGVVDGISEPADVDNDLVAWLDRAGTEDTQSVTGGNPFIVGDANLDGTNDGQDFIQWNNGKFTNNTDWCGNDNGHDRWQL